MRRPLAVLVALLALAATPAAALAAPDCPERSPSRELLSGLGTLESVIVDTKGRLFFTDGGHVLRLDRPGDQPRILADVTEPGGLALEPGGDLIVGTGNSVSNGLAGDLTGPSGLVRLDPDSGAAQPFASGLSMANGLVRGPDGAYYATNDMGSNVDRVLGGQTQRGWAKVDSGNGVAIDSSGRWLYVAQTFRPAAIARVDLRDPASVATHYAAEPADVAAGLDGMTIDAADRLFVTANGAGQVWRVSGSPAQACVVLRGLAGFPDGPSAVAVGARKGPFPATNLYVVTFDGRLIEISGAAVAKKP